MFREDTDFYSTVIKNQWKICFRKNNRSPYKQIMEAHE